MTKKVFQYRVKDLLLIALAWEILLWIILMLLLFVFGYFGQKTTHYLDFESPKFFYSIPFTLIITTIFLLKLRKTNRYYRNNGIYLWRTVYKPNSNTNLFFRYFLFKNTIVFILIALARPAIGVKNYASQSDNTQVLIALDISNSMNVQDLSGESRLTVAKRALSAFTQQLTGEAVGILLFANQSYQYVPYTTDYHAVRMYINDIETQLISDQGTNINATLEKITELQTKILGVSNKVLLLTDGEFHEKANVTLTNSIRDNNLQIAVIGVGTKSGGFIPIDPNNTEVGFKSNENGATVVSILDPNAINSFAKKINAITQIVDNSYPDLFKVYAQMSEVRNTKIHTDFFVSKSQKYHIPVLFAIFSFILYLIWDNKLIIRLDNYFSAKK